MRRPIAIVAAVVLAAMSPIALPSMADAHERRVVGPYQLVVGWLSEPAFAGSVNAVDLRVADTRTEPATPVEGLQDTVQVEVRHGGLNDTLRPALRARFGAPGAYAADLIPTRAGDYTFRFSGRIGDLEIDEVFESGPGRFDDVRAPDALQYPDQVPAGSDLAQRLGDLERDLGSARALAIVALALAVALPIGLARRRGRPRS